MKTTAFGTDQDCSASVYTDEAPANQRHLITLKLYKQKASFFVDDELCFVFLIC